MAIYVNDQNSICFRYDSGTYATPSGTGQWIGQVQDHSVDDNTNVNPIRYVGGSTRNVEAFSDGPLDHTGTFTYFPQDWKMAMFALGSIADGGSPSPYTHEVREVNSADGNAFTSGANNPFISFSLEVAQQYNPTGLNFVRTLNGCMADSLTINMSQGEIISNEVSYVAQSNTYSSGAVTSVTAATTRPYLWSDVSVHLPSGTAVSNVTACNLTISNNIDPKHYLNGSRQIATGIPMNRDYEVSLTVDGNTTWTKTFYEQYFLGGSTFNMMIGVTDVSAGAGSRNAYFVLSGCKLNNMDAPDGIEGTAEQTLTIQPTSCSLNVNDTIEKYGAW